MSVRQSSANRSRSLPDIVAAYRQDSMLPTSKLGKPNKVSTTIFLGPKLKIERANKHIAELQAVLEAFLKTNFYRLGVDNLNDGTNVLTFELIGTLPSDVPLIIGDAIHNLHTALDLMIWEIESRIGKPSRSTKFPFYQTRSELVGAIENGNLKAAPEICHIIIEDIKPYRGGNDLLYGLHELDIMDKHKLLIPIISIVELRGAAGEDDCGGSFRGLNFLISQGGRINAISSSKNLNNELRTTVFRCTFR
jgi:hypothetical protein